MGCLLDGCPFLDVLLAADELVVNALRHTKSGHVGGSFTVEIVRDGGLVAVSVTDQGGPGEPAALDAAELAESGRGLRTHLAHRRELGLARQRRGPDGHRRVRGGVGRVTEPASWTHDQVHLRVHAVMTAAIRADPHSIDAALVQTGSLDPSSRAFVAHSRRLVLACTAALTCVLAAHRPGESPHGEPVCRGCGTPECRTLRGLSHVLAAYSVRPALVDQARHGGARTRTSGAAAAP